jgi:hypothetical protein
MLDPRGVTRAGAVPTPIRRSARPHRRSRDVASAQSKLNCSLWPYYVTLKIQYPPIVFRYHTHTGGQFVP